MKYFFLVVLLICTQIDAKAPKLFSCVQKDGTTVIQDRRCMVTAIQQPKTKIKVPQQLRKTTPDFKPTNRSKLTKKNASKFNKPNSQLNSNVSNRSPYFTFGWDRFIPATWLLKKVETLTYEQTLLSDIQFTGLNDFKQGVKLSVYANTMQTSRLDSFAQALQLYHQIRDNSHFQLVDSQFKAHTKYKVFNIKYQNSDKQLMLTEFYIDESNNDLFVVTVQAAESNWLNNWRMAEQIIKQL